MKRILLLAFLSFLSFPGFSQDGQYHANLRHEYSPNIITLYGGGGCATSNNYDVAPSLGLSFQKSTRGKTRIGAQAFYQQYSLYYDNELNSAKHAQGQAGMILRHLSSYVFVAPNYSFNIANKLNFFSDIAVNAGVGFKISGFDTVRKWDRGYYANGYYTNYTSGMGQYDSLIDASQNINSMLIRVGLTVTQYVFIGGAKRGRHWWFTFKEDFGFMANHLTKTGDVDNHSPSRTTFSPTNIKPGYISLQIGISHISSRKG